MYLLAKSGVNRSYGKGDINFYIKSYLNTLQKLNSPIRSDILRDFHSKEYQFTIPKSHTRLVEKREGEEESRQLLTLCVSRKRKNTSETCLNRWIHVKSKKIKVEIKEQHFFEISSVCTEWLRSKYWSSCLFFKYMYFDELYFHIWFQEAIKVLFVN